jgi:hypothetical protein
VYRLKSPRTFTFWGETDKKWEKAARNGEIIKGQHLILSNIITI